MKPEDIIALSRDQHKQENKTKKWLRKVFGDIMSEEVASILWHFMCNNEIWCNKQELCGSFRWNGGELAAVMNEHTGEQKYDYMDFYLCSLPENKKMVREVFDRVRANNDEGKYWYPAGMNDYALAEVGLEYYIKETRERAERLFGDDEEFTRSSGNSNQESISE